MNITFSKHPVFASFILLVTFALIVYYSSCALSELYFTGTLRIRLLLAIGLLVCLLISVAEKVFKKEKRCFKRKATQ